MDVTAQIKGNLRAIREASKLPKSCLFVKLGLLHPSCAQDVHIKAQHKYLFVFMIWFDMMISADNT